MKALPACYAAAFGAVTESISLAFIFSFAYSRCHGCIIFGANETIDQQEVLDPRT